MSLECLTVRVYRRLPRRLQLLAVRWRTPNFNVGALALITDGTDRMLLVRPSYRAGWLPPGGFLDRGEEPVAALERELEEELGIRVHCAPPHRVAFDAARQGVTFISTVLVPPDQQFAPRSCEILDARWFPFDALPPLPNDFFEGLPEEDLAAMRNAGQAAQP